MTDQDARKLQVGQEVLVLPDIGENGADALCYTMIVDGVYDDEFHVYIEATCREMGLTKSIVPALGIHASPEHAVAWVNQAYNAMEKRFMESYESSLRSIKRARTRTLKSIGASPREMISAENLVS